MKVSDLIKKKFPGKYLSKKDIKVAGRLLKNKGVEETLLFVEERLLDYKSFNAQPPVNCDILYQSRPFEEWPIVKFSNSVQTYVYNLTENDFNQTNILTQSSTKDQIKKYLELSKIDNFGWTNVQSINHIIPNIYNTYGGVITKAKNKEEKTKEKQKFFNQDGCLTHKPGLNNNIYCCQNFPIFPYNPIITKNNRGTDLSEIFPNYTREPTDRPLLNNHKSKYGSEHPHKRKRNWYSNQQRKRSNILERKFQEEFGGKSPIEDAILFCVKIEKDFIVFDARGLLRNIKYRLLKNKSINIDLRNLRVKDLIEYFTDSPIIDAKRKIITFRYKEGIIENYWFKSTHSFKNSEKLLKEFLSKNNKVGLLTIDLGQTNVVGYRISVLDQNYNLSSVSNGGLPKKYLDLLAKYRNDYDKFKEQIIQQSLNELPEEISNEYKFCKENNADKTLKIIYEKYNLKIEKDILEKMSSYTTHISDMLIENGNEGAAYFVLNNGKNKDNKLKRSDRKFAQENKPKLSQETNKIFNEKQWEIQKNSSEFLKFSKRKKEILKSIVNWLRSECRKQTNCNIIVIGLEKLNKVGGFFDGKGKINVGWENFFKFAKENRWFIKELHTHICNLSSDKGEFVIELPPYNTSQTCPSCKNIEAKNRNGEKFKCINCNFEGNTDIDIAPYWLEQCLITGMSVKDQIKKSDVAASGQIVSDLEGALATEAGV